MQRLAMMTLASLLGACGAGEIAAEPTTDDRGGDLQQEIVGGQTFSDLPAVGALTLNGSIYCTGTLIAPRKVLTAAHCVDGFSASQVRFAIGPNSSTPQSTVKAAALTAHPQWDEGTLANDIGIVTLAADAPVAPLGVVDAIDNGWVGKSLLFVGYGVSNGVTQSGAGRKRSVTMPVSRVRATIFEYGSSSANTCNGDSGGPALVQGSDGAWRIAGVTSYGDATCRQFGADTRVDVYKDFLGLGGTTPTPPPTDPCGGETFEGRCDGSTVTWCENDTVQTSNCTSRGKTCGFAEDLGYYACVTSDPCQGETFAGRCSNGTVVWCENSSVQKLDCQAQGQSCDFDQGNGFYNCL